MEALHARCAGLDISKRDAKVCVRVAAAGRPREVFRALQGRCAVPDNGDLSPARQTRNLTLAAVASELTVWPSAISQLELGQRVDNDLVTRYRNWLTAA